MLLYGLLWLQKSMNFIKTGLPPDFSLGNLTNQDQSNFCLPVSMRLRAHDGTAIGMKHLPGHVAGIVRGQEDITGRHLAGLARPEHGDLGSAGTKGAYLLHRVRRGDVRRPDGTGGHGVNPDALVCQRQRQRAGEGHNSSLGSAVIGEIFVPLIGGDGGGIDDRGPSFQMRQRRLDQVEKRVHVVLKYQGELLPRDIQA